MWRVCVLQPNIRSQMLFSSSYPAYVHLQIRFIYLSVTKPGPTRESTCQSSPSVSWLAVTRAISRQRYLGAKAIKWTHPDTGENNEGQTACALYHSSRGRRPMWHPLFVANLPTVPQEDNEAASSHPRYGNHDFNPTHDNKLINTEIKM